MNRPQAKLQRRMFQRRGGEPRRPVVEGQAEPGALLSPGGSQASRVNRSRSAPPPRQQMLRRREPTSSSHPVCLSGLAIALNRRPKVPASRAHHRAVLYVQAHNLIKRRA